MYSLGCRLLISCLVFFYPLPPSETEKMMYHISQNGNFWLSMHNAVQHLLDNIFAIRPCFYVATCDIVCCVFALGVGLMQKFKFDAETNWAMDTCVPNIHRICVSVYVRTCTFSVTTTVKAINSKPTIQLYQFYSHILSSNTKRSSNY